MLAGFVLLALGALSPWALLRLLPLGEIASAAASSLRSETLGRELACSRPGSGAARWRTSGRSTTARDAPRRRQDSATTGRTVRGLGGNACRGSCSRDPGGGCGAGAGERRSAAGGAVAGAGDRIEGARRAPRGTRAGRAAGPGGRGRRNDARAPAAPAPPMAAPAPPRAPGMGPIWQARDDGWPTLKLGLEHGWPPRTNRRSASARAPSGPPEPGTPRPTNLARRQPTRGPRPAARRSARRGRLAVTERLSYRFGPLERRGILGAVRVGQAALLAVGAAAAIAALDLSPTAAGGFGALVLFAAATALAFVPIGRRTPEEWAPIAGTFALAADSRTPPVRVGRADGRDRRPADRRRTPPPRRSDRPPAPLAEGRRAARDPVSGPDDRRRLGATRAQARRRCSRAGSSRSRCSTRRHRSDV